MTLLRLRNGLLLLEIALVALFAYGYYRWTIEWRLNGTVVQGAVTETFRLDDGSAFVVYDYTVDGATYSRIHRVHDDFFAGTSVGQPVEVIYSPADVAVSGIPGQGGGDFDLPRLPGIFFDLRFLAFVLPALILVNLAGIIGLTIAMIRRRKTAK
ncbi:MAG: hypothetical protein H6672_02480 [Anaerolineaceae bacterium]|nr:hypothetical protein [Anaerolineaceae bacterium]